MERNQVVLVDKDDHDIGIMDKMEAHQKGELHRAFSVFIFNDKNELLIQQRAAEKYHSPRLWTNTCCSHPQQGEKVEESAKKRLLEEMGFECDLTKLFHFTYKADVGQGLIEHEFDHVFKGTYNQQPNPHASEVMSTQWLEIDFLEKDMMLNPEKYTVWFRIIFEKYILHLT